MRGRGLRFTRARQSRWGRRTTMGDTTIRSPATTRTACTGSERPPWVRSFRMRSDCTMCTGTYGSGWRIAGTGTMGERRVTEVHGVGGLWTSGVAGWIVAQHLAWPALLEPQQEHLRDPEHQLRIPSCQDAELSHVSWCLCLLGGRKAPLGRFFCILIGIGAVSPRQSSERTQPAMASHPPMLVAPQ